IQESVVLGGSLSGVYYASGTHLWNAANLRNNGGGFMEGGGHNMNRYCQDACTRTGASTGWCQEHCGHAAGGDPEAGGVITFSHHVTGYSTEPRVLHTASGGSG